MGQKTIKPGAKGLLGKIMSAPGKAGAGLAEYLLKGLYIKKGKGAKGAKSVKPK
jgi:hypothetical protein